MRKRCCTVLGRSFMKKIVVYIFALLLVILPLGACGGQHGAGETEKIKIVSAIFPSYDWVREILGERSAAADLELLIDNGVDMHSYQPSAQDMITISDCDMFIYVGGESDAWVQDALRANDNPDRVVIDLMQVLKDAQKVTEEEPDEHIWLSLKNAKVLCTSIADQLAQMDTDGAEIYTSNLQTYIEKLDALDEQYRTTVENAEQKTLIFGDRFPFRYLFADYGIECHAAFAGCSADSEVSFETVVSLAEKLDTLDLSAVLVSETSDKTLAKTIVENSKTKDQEILVLDSIQSVTADQAEKGISYLSIMEKNLAVLRSALQKQA